MHSIKITLFVMIMAPLLAAFSALTQANEMPEQGKDIASSVQHHASEFLKDTRFTSVSVGVVKNGQSYSGHFGELTPGGANPANNDTLFEIASVSKTMTGLLVSQAIQDNKLGLDQNVDDYVPESLANISPVTQPITVRQLLTHTSGLPKSESELNFHIESMDRGDFLRLLNGLDISARNTQFNYSNIGVELLSYVLESVYAKPFDALLSDFYQARAGMADTRINLSDEALQRFAYGYDDKGQLMPAHIEPEVLWGGSGNVKSSMSDMLKYIALQLDTTDAVVQRAQQKLFRVGGNDSMAYLWIAVDSQDLGTYLVHHGGMEGTQNWLMIFPELDMGISVITNSSFAQAAGIIKRLALRIVDDIKPSGVKSLTFAMDQACIKDAGNCIALYHKLKACCLDIYNFDNPSELNNLGYTLLYADMPLLAVDVFKLLTSEFPADANGFDSLGEAAYLTGQYSLAQQSYKQALRLNPKNANAQAMLEKLAKQNHSNTE